MSKIIIIGSGFSGLAAASFLAKEGHEVIVLEKNALPGGRARRFEASGFTFDMGPSWYWMPDVFERFFALFGNEVTDYYELERLDPSYRVYWNDKPMDIPAKYENLRTLFESVETGSANKLDAFLKEAEYKYRVGMQKLVFKPGRSLSEFLDKELFSGIFRLDVFTSMKKHVNKYFKDEKLRQLMEFPILFLGASPQNTPALYSLMNYADIKLGTWYPKGGMYSIVEAMHKLALSLNVKFQFNTEATGFKFEGKSIKSVVTNKGSLRADVVLAAADYHHVETLLPQQLRSYSNQYWKTRKMAPSCLIYFVGLNKKLPELLHHSLFFDTPFSQHAREIYAEPAWPKEPLFYVSCTSATDEKTAPEGCENLFILIPVSSKLENDTIELRQKYFDMVIKRMEQHLGENLMEHIIFKRGYAKQDFIDDYHAFQGNAYGLANTLRQTAILKPSMKSKKISNLFFAGQLTVPGPGVPPALISGEVAAKEIFQHL